MSDTDILVKAAEVIAAYEAALISIASFNDAGGNEVLKNRGSYSAFDEPGSVQLAREALTLGQELSKSFSHPTTKPKP